MSSANELQVSLAPYLPSDGKEFDLDRIIFDLDGELAKVTSQADAADYIVSIASGLLCGVLDILWVGDFSLERGRNLASEKVDGFVTKTAKLLGYDKATDALNARFGSATIVRGSSMQSNLEVGKKHKAQVEEKNKSKH